MSLQLDTSLRLVYKNMVGLSNIVVDQSVNTFLKNSLSINSEFIINILSFNKIIIY